MIGQCDRRCHTDEQRCYRIAVAVLIDRDDRGGRLTVHEHFPAKIMGSVFGIVAIIAALGMALGPPVGGWLFDRLGEYGWLYIASSAIGIAALDGDDPTTAPTAPGDARGGSLILISS